jgi:hypothetical protein
MTATRVICDVDGRGSPGQMVRLKKVVALKKSYDASSKASSVYGELARGGNSAKSHVPEKILGPLLKESEKLGKD